MKFLIDAHLPPSLRRTFATAGHDAIHTLDLPEQNASRDGLLNEVSVRDQRIVVNKTGHGIYYDGACVKLKQNTGRLLPEKDARTSSSESQKRRLSIHIWCMLNPALRNSTIQRDASKCHRFGSFKLNEGKIH